MTPLASVMFLPGMNVPTGENTLFMPVRALGAPQTTCTGSPPASTMQTRRRSALGCCLASITRATTKPLVFRAGVLDALDLQADARQRVDDLGERSRGFQVVFEPGEGEFHRAIITGAVRLAPSSLRGKVAGGAGRMRGGSACASAASVAPCREAPLIRRASRATFPRKGGRGSRLFSGIHGESRQYFGD